MQDLVLGAESCGAALLRCRASAYDAHDGAWPKFKSLCRSCIILLTIINGMHCGRNEIRWAEESS